MTTSAPATSTARGFRTLTVDAVDHDTDDSIVVTFDCGDAPLSFAHGQHLTLRREIDGVEIRRSYSICSRAPDGPLRIAIKRVPGGAFSTWATSELRPGDTCEVMPPSGHFSHELRPERQRRYALLAAGSGITPVLSIIATILEHEPLSSVSLVYVNRTSTSTMLLEDLEDLRDRHLGRLRIAYLFTREASEAELLSGRPDRARLDALIHADLLPAAVDHAFLCGPLELTTAAEAALTTAGLEPASIHREVFTTDQVGSARRQAPQPVSDELRVVAEGSALLFGRETDIVVYEGDSVLDAVQRVRPDAPFSCRSGVCSTCQATLTDGDVEMAVNYGLDSHDLARGYVLTCQSTPTTSSVRVDYDT